MTTTLTRREQAISPFFDDLFEIEPFAELRPARRTMNTLLESFMRPARLPEFSVPAMDLYKKDGSYIVEVALPGLEKKDISIEVVSNCLTVTGRYEKTDEDDDKRYHYRELRRGDFSRSVTFPEAIDPDKVVADFAKGMLTIEIPSLKPAETKKIAIK
jgi:HSP20 family protein